MRISFTLKMLSFLTPVKNPVFFLLPLPCKKL